MATGVPSSVTQAPISPNFAETKRFVVDYVQGSDDEELLDIAKRGVNSGIDRLNTRDWNWNVRRQTVTLVASTAEYALNTNFKKPRKLWVLNSDSKVETWLQWLDFKSYIDEKTSSTSDGHPIVYTVEAPKHYGKLIIDPSPSTDFVSSYPTLRLYYHARVPYLSQDSDMLDAPPEVWSMVAWYARWDMALVRGQTSVVIDRAYQNWREFERRLTTDDLNTMTDWEV